MGITPHIHSSKPLPYPGTASARVMQVETVTYIALGAFLGAIGVWFALLWFTTKFMPNFDGTSKLPGEEGEEEEVALEDVVEKLIKKKVSTKKAKTQQLRASKT